MQPDDLFDEERFRPTPEDQLPPADLTELMVQAHQNPAYFPEFCRRLMVEPLLVLVEELPEDWEPGSKERVGLPLLHMQGGEIPVFTSNEALFSNPDIDRATTKSIFVVGRELFGALVGKTILLNPFSEVNLQISPAFIDQLLNGEIKPNDMHGGEINMDEEDTEDYVERVPAEYAEAAEQLTQQFCLLLGQHPRVRTAYLIWQRDMDNDQESCFLVLLVMEGDPHRVTQEMGLVARDYIKPLRRNLKMLINADPTAFDPYAEGLQVAPFYEG